MNPERTQQAIASNGVAGLACSETVVVSTDGYDDFFEMLGRSPRPMPRLAQRLATPVPWGISTASGQTPTPG